MSIFLELLRYVLYIKNEKAKVHIFSGGFPLEFRDQIEYGEAQSVEDVIGKLKHCYQQSMCKTKSQRRWKGKENEKGKWQLKKTRSQNAEEKENVAPYKNFNVVRQGHGQQPEGHHNRGDDKGQLQFWACGKQHVKRYCLQNQGDRPQIYSAHEAYTIGDIEKSIPHMYATLDNKKENYQEYLIEMDGKLSDHFISILIEPRSTYIMLTLTWWICVV